MAVVEEDAAPAQPQQPGAQTDAQAQSQQPPKRANDHNAMFLRASRAGNLEQVLEFLRNGIDINTCNSNGLNALHLASKEGHNEVVRELIRRGAIVDAATKKGNTALHIASLAGQDIIVTILVENGANVNAQSLNGFTPLYMSAQENHETVVRYLLAHGGNQALATEDGFTPLAVALQQGHDRIVALLLENDNNSRIKLPALHIAAKKDDTRAAALLLQNEQNPNVTSKSGFTPLHIAAHYGNEAIAELLLDKGANVNFQARHNISPLHVAAKWGRVNLANLLLTRGAIIDCRTRDLLTPLHCAARSGNDAVVDLLLDKGAPIGAKTKNGLASLHMAAQGDHVDCARILLYHRAPVDDLTVDYLTPLHVAAHCGHVRVAKLLLDRQADPNARALNGFTPLHIACKKNRLKVVELLLKYRASVEATTESGLSPLHVAAFMGCINIVIFLIQQGANVDVETIRGETPLHLATRANQTDIVRVLVRNRANVNAQARVLQTPLHIAARLGNTDIVVNLLNANANPNAATRDQYTPLHIAAKEGQEEVAALLLDHRADMSLLTKKGFAPLHLASKYGNYAVAKLLLERGTPVDILGKNQVTPLHVATHYSHEQVAQLLLKNKASAQASAKNGYTPLHIAAKKNQMDIAAQLISYRADPNAESRAGFTPLHLTAEVGHHEMAALLIENGSQVNAQARNGLTPMHLCAQEDCVNVAAELLKHGADLNAQTKAGYTPLHVACHYGALNMVRFLLENGAAVGAQTKANYTPLHQAAQQGHNVVVRCLLEHGASPNTKTTSGQTPLSIAQRLGYVSVVETLKTVTETTVITETTTVTEERYRPQNPEAMNETMFSDSEDEVDEHQAAVGEHARDFNESITQGLRDSAAVHLIHTGEQQPLVAAAHHVGASLDATDADLEAVIKQAQNAPITEAVPDPTFLDNGHDDNSPILQRDLIQPSKLSLKTFLISFLVDARGGAMRGCRHSGVRVIIPPRKAPAPMRITCRYLKREKLSHPPPLSEGEALASRILEMGPHGAKFLGPVILEIPHFASLRNREREIVILRSDDGQHWKEHQLEATEDAVQEVLNESFNASDLQQLDDLHTSRITRILTSDFPMYFAVVTRVRQEVHLVGPEGGVILSSVIQRVQAIFPDGSLTKTIKVSLQAQPVPHEIVAKLHGNRVAVSPIVTVEPRRRKFHKPITLYIPLPQGGHRGMLNQYGGAAVGGGPPAQQHTGQDPPTLRLLCSITGGSSPAQWEDITGTTQLTFSGEDVSFTTTVSARFWLMDCQTPRDSARMAQEVYNEAIAVPYMAKFCVFARRPYPVEGQLRLFCMTDDREDKTLEKQESFVEVAKSRDVEVLSNRQQFLEFGGNLVPVAKTGDQLSVYFLPFQENRLAFNVKVRQSDSEEAINAGRIAIMKEARQRAENIPPQHPICTLTITLPDYTGPLPSLGHSPELGVKKYTQDVDRTPIGVKYSTALALNPAETDLPLELVARKIGLDWPRLARSLGVPDSDVRQIKRELTSNGGAGQEPITILKIWIHLKPQHASVGELEQALRRIGRDDIVRQMNKQEPDYTEGESLRLADASNLAGQSRSNFSSRGSIPHDRVADMSPARFTSAQRGGYAPSPELADEMVVTRTERYVHHSKTPTGGSAGDSGSSGPVVDERTITRVYRAGTSPEAMARGDAADVVEERVTERLGQAPTEEERRIWREGGTSRSRTDGGATELLNSREAMILDTPAGSQDGAAGTQRTTTLVTRHVQDGDSASVSVVSSSDDYGSHRVSLVSDTLEANAAPSPATQPIVEEEERDERAERSVSATAHRRGSIDDGVDIGEEPASVETIEPVAISEESVAAVPTDESVRSPASSNGSVVLREEEQVAVVPEPTYHIATSSSVHEEDEEENEPESARRHQDQDQDAGEGLPGFDAKSAAGAASNANGKDHQKSQRNGEDPLQYKSSVEEVLVNEDGSRVTSKRLTRVVTTSHSTVSGLDQDYSNGRSVNDDEDSSSIATTSIGSVRDRINIFESMKTNIPVAGRRRSSEKKLEEPLSQQISSKEKTLDEFPNRPSHAEVELETKDTTEHEGPIELTNVNIEREKQLYEPNISPTDEQLIAHEFTESLYVQKDPESENFSSNVPISESSESPVIQNTEITNEESYDQRFYEEKESEPVKYAELKTVVQREPEGNVTIKSEEHIYENKPEGPTDESETFSKNLDEFYENLNTPTTSEQEMQNESHKSPLQVTDDQPENRETNDEKNRILKNNEIIGDHEALSKMRSITEISSEENAALLAGDNEDRQIPEASENYEQRKESEPLSEQNKEVPADHHDLITESRDQEQYKQISSYHGDVIELEKSHRKKEEQTSGEYHEGISSDYVNVTEDDDHDQPVELIHCESIDVDNRTHEPTVSDILEECHKQRQRKQPSVEQVEQYTPISSDYGSVTEDKHQPEELIHSESIDVDDRRENIEERSDTEHHEQILSDFEGAQEEPRSFDVDNQVEHHERTTNDTSDLLKERHFQEEVLGAEQHIPTDYGSVTEDKHQPEESEELIHSESIDVGDQAGNIGEQLNTEHHERILNDYGDDEEHEEAELDTRQQILNDYIHVEEYRNQPDKLVYSESIIIDNPAGASGIEHHEQTRSGSADLLGENGEQEEMVARHNEEIPEGYVEVTEEEGYDQGKEQLSPENPERIPRHAMKEKALELTDSESIDVDNRTNLEERPAAEHHEQISRDYADLMEESHNHQELGKEEYERVPSDYGSVTEDKHRDQSEELIHSESIDVDDRRENIEERLGAEYRERIPSDFEGTQEELCDQPDSFDAHNQIKNHEQIASDSADVLEERHEQEEKQRKQPSAEQYEAIPSDYGSVTEDKHQPEELIHSESIDVGDQTESIERRLNTEHHGQILNDYGDDEERQEEELDREQPIPSDYDQQDELIHSESIDVDNHRANLESMHYKQIATGRAGETEERLQDDQERMESFPKNISHEVETYQNVWKQIKTHHPIYDEHNESVDANIDDRQVNTETNEYRLEIVESESYYDINTRNLSFDDQSIPKIPHLIVEEEASNKSEDEDQEEEQEEPYQHPLPRYQQKRNQRKSSEEKEHEEKNLEEENRSSNSPQLEDPYSSDIEKRSDSQEMAIKTIFTNQSDQDQEKIHDQNEGATSIQNQEQPENLQNEKNTEEYKVETLKSENVFPSNENSIHSISFAESRRDSDDYEDNSLQHVNEGNEVETAVNVESVHIGIASKCPEFSQQMSIEENSANISGEIICSEQITRYDSKAEDYGGIHEANSQTPLKMGNDQSDTIVESESYDKELCSGIEALAKSTTNLKDEDSTNLMSESLVDSPADNDALPHSTSNEIVESESYDDKLHLLPKRQKSLPDRVETDITENTEGQIQEYAENVPASTTSRSAVGDDKNSSLDELQIHIEEEFIESAVVEKIDPHNLYHSDVVREITTLSETELADAHDEEHDRQQQYEQEKHNKREYFATTEMKFSPAYVEVKDKYEEAGNELNNNEVEGDQKDEVNKDVSTSKISVDRSSSRESFETNATETTIILKNDQTPSKTILPESIDRDKDYELCTEYTGGSSDSCIQTRSLSNEQHYMQIGSDLEKMDDAKRPSIVTKSDIPVNVDFSEKITPSEEEYDIITTEEITKTLDEDEKIVEPTSLNTDELVGKGTVIPPEFFTGNIDENKQSEAMPRDELAGDILEQSTIFDANNDQLNIETEEKGLTEVRGSKSVLSPTEDSQEVLLTKEDEIVPMDPSPSSLPLNVIAYFSSETGNNNFDSSDQMTQSIYENKELKLEVIGGGNLNSDTETENKRTDLSIDDFDIINPDEVDQVMSKNPTECIANAQASAIVSEVFDRIQSTPAEVDVQEPVIRSGPTSTETIDSIHTEEVEPELELIENNNNSNKSSLFVMKEFYRPKSPIPPAESKDEIEDRSFVKRLDDGDDVFLDSPIQGEKLENNEAPITQVLHSISLTEKLFKTEELPEVQASLDTQLMSNLPEKLEDLQDDNISRKSEFPNESEESESSSSSSLKRKERNNELAIAAANVSDNISSEGSLMEFERIEQEILNRKQEQAKSASGSPNKTQLNEESKSLQKEGGTTGSITSLTEFENLEREIIRNLPNSSGLEDSLVSIIAEEDVMVLSDIREESEDAEEVKGELEDKLSIHDEECDISGERDSLAGISPEMRQPYSQIRVEDIHQVLSDAMLSSADSLEVGEQPAEIIMETSADSLELSHPSEQGMDDKLDDVDRDSLIELATQAIHSQNPSSDTGHMTADTDMTYQDYQKGIDEEIDEKEILARSFPTTTTTFETTQTHEDGTIDTIIRRVQTRVTDPVHSHIRFTGTEDESCIQNVQRSSDDVHHVESVDDDGNITTISCRRTSPPH